jgi:hypothetical protein
MSWLNRVVGGSAVLALSTFALPARADRAETVQRLVAESRSEDAREKCEKWGAASITDDPALREACAQAFALQAEAAARIEDWASFRERWSGTRAAREALPREAAVALVEIPDDAPEDELIEAADRYKGTPAEPTLRSRAADSAVRDAATPKAAASVAQRYPAHPGLPALVERFPEGFVKVVVVGRSVQIAVEPPIELLGPRRPQSRFVLRDAEGQLRPWDEAARALLLASGVTQAAIDAVPVPKEGLRYPVCWAPSLGQEQVAGVAVSVGSGSLFRPIAWDPGCGPDAWPAPIVLQQGRLVGLSMGPGERLDARGSALPGGRQSIRAFVGEPEPVPFLEGEALLRRFGGLWMGDPLHGGAPWVTGRDPGPAAQPLSAELFRGPLPAGWVSRPEGDDQRISGAALDKAGVSAPWTLPAGELRVASPIAAAALGLRPRASEAVVAPLGADAGWLRAPDGSVERQPPTGGSPAGLYLLPPADLERSLAVAAMAGLDAAQLVGLDGWGVDLDLDRVQETVLRVTYQGGGLLIVLDPFAAGPVSSIADARVFAISAPRAVIDQHAVGTPFTFRRGSTVYFAWTGLEAAGSAAPRAFVELLRAEGPSYRAEAVDLP